MASLINDNYSDEDFSFMMFNVMKVSRHKSILEAFPALQKYHEFTNLTEFEHDDLLRFIFLLYDRGSPLKRIEDLMRRKMEAAQLAGFKTDKEGYFEPAVDLMMKGFDSYVNQMIIRCVRMQHDVTFATMVTGYESLFQKLELTLSASLAHEKKSEVEIEKIKGELWKQAKLMRDDLDAMALTLLNNDNNPYLRKDLFCIIDRESQDLQLTPEKYAQRSKAEI